MKTFVGESRDFTELLKELDLIPNNVDTVKVQDFDFTEILKEPDLIQKNTETLKEVAANTDFFALTSFDKDGKEFPILFENFVLPLCEMDSLDAISMDFSSEDEVEFDIDSCIWGSSESKEDEEIISCIFEMECSQKALEEKEQEKEEEKESKNSVRNIWDTFIIETVNF